jgi:hypothetical protein
MLDTATMRLGAARARLAERSQRRRVDGTPRGDGRPRLLDAVVVVADGANVPAGRRERVERRRADQTIGERNRAKLALCGASANAVLRSGLAIFTPTSAPRGRPSAASRSVSAPRRRATDVA